MSSSVPIPQRKPPSLFSASSSTYSSWSSNTSSTSPGRTALPTSSSSSSRDKGKARATDVDDPPKEGTTMTMTWQGEAISPRRPSLLGRDMLKESLHTVVQLGNGRLVTCVKSSQGFDWNQELFLPSYASEDSSDLEHKPDPVEEIVLTEEELAVLPQ